MFCVRISGISEFLVTVLRLSGFYSRFWLTKHEDHGRKIVYKDGNEGRKDPVRRLLEDPCYILETSNGVL